MYILGTRRKNRFPLREGTEKYGALSTRAHISAGCCLGAGVISDTDPDSSKDESAVLSATLLVGSMLMVTSPVESVLG